MPMLWAAPGSGSVIEADGQPPTDLELSCAAEPDNVAVIRRAVAGVARAAGVDEGLVNDVRTVVTEACGNAVVHAYPTEAPGNVEVTCAYDHPWLSLRIRDFGVGMQPQVDGDAEPRLRIGLSLMSVLADRFEIQSGARIGTTVLVGFDVARSRDGDRESGPWAEAGDRLDLAAAGPLGAEAIPPALVMLGVRSGLTVDRLSELERVGAVLAAAVRDGKVDQLELRAAPMSAPVVYVEVDPGSEGAAAWLVESLPGGIGELIDRDGVTIIRVALEDSADAR